MLYLTGYVADPKKRDVGFGLSAVPIVILMVAALIGVVRALLAEHGELGARLM